MITITLHPKSQEEITFFEYLAKRLNTPYKINRDAPKKLRKKPSDFFGSISETEGMEMHKYLAESREESEKNI
ncbi:MAG: hypothetical protein KF870_04250 [Leadbetterella sp.]|nr:hypothetical protein [Leadbetterella sp.]